MATTPIIHTYQEVNAGKYNTVRHFQLIKTNTGKPQLSEMLNISKDRDCAKSSPVFWVKEKEGKVWKKHYLTGLFTTGFSSLYRGDTNSKEHLVVFCFEENLNRLTVLYFKNGYKSDIDSLLVKIKQWYNKQQKTV